MNLIPPKTLRHIAACTLLTCPLLISNINTSAAADEAFENPSITLLDAMVVTGTRNEQSLDAALQPTIVISQEDIERTAAQDVGDLIRTYANIDLGRNGGTGQTTSVFIRGAESDHVMLLIDGVRINPATGTGPAWMHVNPDSIDRIEIIKGPRSALYGSDAIGGVINIITKRKQSTNVSLQYTTGEYGTNSATGAINFRKGQLATGISLTDYHTDGFPAKENTDINSAHKYTSFAPYLKYGNETYGIELRYWQNSGITNYVGSVFDFVTFTSTDAARSQNFINRVGAISGYWAISDLWETNLTYSRTKDDIQQNESPDFARTDRIALDWQNDIYLDNHHFIVGLYQAEETASALSFGTGYTQDDNIRAVYGQWLGEFNQLSSLLALRHSDYDNFGSEITGNVEAGYSISKKFRLTAGYGTAFRAPSGAERFGFGANPDLAPESSQNIELGLQYQWKMASIQNQIELAAFDNQIDNLISFFDPDGFSGPTPGQFQNIQKASIRGIELRYSGSIDRVNLRAEIAYQNPQNDSTNQPLVRRAKRSGSLLLSYQQERWFTQLNMTASGRRPDIFGGELAGYALFGASAGIKWHGLTATIKADNLLDADYTLALDSPGRAYQTAGRAFYFTLGYTLSE